MAIRLASGRGAVYKLFVAKVRTRTYTRFTHTTNRSFHTIERGSGTEAFTSQCIAGTFSLKRAVVKSLTVLDSMLIGKV